MPIFSTEWYDFGVELHLSASKWFKSGPELQAGMRGDCKGFAIYG